MFCDLCEFGEFLLFILCRIYLYWEFSPTYLIETFVIMQHPGKFVIIR